MLMKPALPSAMQAVTRYCETQPIAVVAAVAVLVMFFVLAMAGLRRPMGWLLRPITGIAARFGRIATDVAVVYGAVFLSSFILALGARWFDPGPIPLSVLLAKAAVGCLGVVMMFGLGIAVRWAAASTSGRDAGVGDLPALTKGSRRQRDVGDRKNCSAWLLGSAGTRVTP